MSKTALKQTDGEISITLYDPLVPMLKNTGSHFEKIPDMANGVFEHIPFRNEEFDAVLCGYSLRDAINLRVAISEIHRVLKKEGRMVIVDLGKPDEDFKNDKGNLVFVYNTKKYGIPCERRFEVDPNSVVVGFVSNGCF